MTAELLEKFVSPVEEPDRRVKWTRAEFEKFEDSGLWGDRKFELLEGVLYDKMGKKPPHSKALVKFNAWAHANFDAESIRSESPIAITPADAERSRPEPDLVITTVGCDEYDGDPGADAIALLIEVSDSTLREDLSTKTRLYARAGVQEYWVLDVRARRLIVQRIPKDDDYAEVRIIVEHDSIAPLCAPDKPLIVSSVLPKC
ncbi:MAG: Uma2 family endonuclease [Acidobacteria bacterium]|nr:Uma2 family endonuclease [Acidobacteriota bacterium]